MGFLKESGCVKEVKKLLRNSALNPGLSIVVYCNGWVGQVIVKENELYVFESELLRLRNDPFKELHHFSFMALKILNTDNVLCYINIQFIRRVSYSKALKVFVGDPISRILRSLTSRPQTLPYGMFFQALCEMYTTASESEKFRQASFSGIPQGRLNELSFKRYLVFLKVDLNKNFLAADSKQDGLQKLSQQTHSEVISSELVTIQCIKDFGLREKEETELVSLGLKKKFLPIKNSVDAFIRQENSEAFDLFQQRLGFPSLGRPNSRRIVSKPTDLYGPNLMRIRDILAFYYVFYQVKLMGQMLQWGFFFQEIYDFAPDLYRDYLRETMKAKASNVGSFRQNRPFEAKIRRQLKKFSALTNINFEC